MKNDISDDENDSDSFEENGQGGNPHSTGNKSDSSRGNGSGPSTGVNPSSEGNSSGSSNDQGGSGDGANELSKSEMIIVALSGLIL